MAAIRMTKKRRAILLAALEDIKRERISPSLGICGNFRRFLTQIGVAFENRRGKERLFYVVWIESHMNEWPDIHRLNNGRPDGVYPVGGQWEYDNERLNGTVWANPRRLALLDWLIERAKG